MIPSCLLGSWPRVCLRACCSVRELRHSWRARAPFVTRAEPLKPSHPSLPSWGDQARGFPGAVLRSVRAGEHHPLGGPRQSQPRPQEACAFYSRAAAQRHLGTSAATPYLVSRSMRLGGLLSPSLTSVLRYPQIVDQLATHVEIALTDASESVNAYEEGLVDCTVQFQASRRSAAPASPQHAAYLLISSFALLVHVLHALEPCIISLVAPRISFPQFAKKLEAKGQRKSAETAAAFKKLQDMQNRIRPQAERCKDKLTMLMQKQTMDLERWLLRHATAVKLLQEQSVTSLSACLRLQERMLISRSGAAADGCNMRALHVEQRPQCEAWPRCVSSRIVCPCLVTLFSAAGSRGGGGGRGGNAGGALNRSHA